MNNFRLWVFGCSHLTRDAAPKDIAKRRESLGDAIRHSLTPEFGGWDAAVDLGDHSGELYRTPGHKAGIEVGRQFAAAAFRRADIFSVQGNHDREGPGEPAGWWFRRYVDPLGENPHISGVNSAARKYAVEGTWERYKWNPTGSNIMVLMISDVTRPQTNLRGLAGGDPGGVYTQETFDWWKEQVERHRSTHIVITCHHYLPKNTTLATGDFEGGELVDGLYQGNFHGAGRDPRGSGRLHYCGEEADATHFIDHLAEHPGDIEMWLGAHTHARPGNVVNGRGLRVYKHGAHFINCAALTRFHGGPLNQVPRSRVFVFTDGSNKVAMSNWHHTAGDYAAAIGYHGTPVTLTLSRTISLA